MLFGAGRLLLHLSLNLSPKFSRRFSRFPQPIQQILSHIPSRQRRRAIQEAQQALTDHLHITRSVHITYAEQISRNSIFSLVNAISKIDFSVADFAERFASFLNYHPIDELDFFYESIGIHHKELRLVVPSDQVFIGKDFRAFNVACFLSGFGFPWNRLGELYKNDASVFSMDPMELNDRVLYLKQSGFETEAVVGICLAFPNLLHIEFDLDPLCVMLDALKFVNQWTSEHQNLDFWYDLTSIMKVVYSMGAESGNVRNLMDKCTSMFVEHTVEVFIRRVQYFCRLGVEKKDVFMLLLERPELLGLDLDTPKFSIAGFLKHFGMSEDEVQSISQKFPYVMGRNKMANLPCAMRAMDLQNWFFNRLKIGNHALLGSYAVDDHSNESHKLYKDGLEKILSSSCAVEKMSKLKIVHSIGFGENEVTLKMFNILNKYNTLLEKIDCFVDCGADYSRLCRAIACWPSMLRQDLITITEKLDFLVNEMGLSLSYFFNHPECFDFDLDKRIKPRIKFYDWLAEKGLDTVSYSLCKKLKQDDKNFVASISSIHPAAPKHYFECFAHSPKIRAPRKHNYPDLFMFGCTFLSNVPICYHDRVIQEAQQALMDHLHVTRSIHITYAEQICKNSFLSLSNVISNIDFSISTFREDFVNFLNCHQIDELDFFYESIGFHKKDIPLLSNVDQKLCIEEFNAFNVACALYGLGFPWNRLGEVCNGVIFSNEAKQLTDRVLYLGSCGFENIAVVGMCLAFPELLGVGSESGDVEFLLIDFKRVYELTIDVHQLLDSSLDIFRKIKLLYSIGFGKGELCSLADNSKFFFLDYSEDILIKKIEYFCKFGVGRKDVGLLLLKSPEVIGLDLTTPEFSVLGFLRHFGMGQEELKSISVKFPHVLGRHKMANMPSVMRALDLQNWFFSQMHNDNHELLRNYTSDNSCNDIDKCYAEGLNQIRLSKSRIRALSKLKFLHGIGFGENNLTMKLSPRITGHHARLEDRFKCFIDLGAEYSKMVGILLRVPAILDNEPDAIKEKVNYLFNEMGLSWFDLYKNPLVLGSDLDRQLNPRFRFHEWLIEEKGLSTKPFSLATLMTIKGTRHMGMMFRIHPAAPKHYLECFMYREPQQCFT